MYYVLYCALKLTFFLFWKLLLIQWLQQICERIVTFILYVILIFHYLWLVLLCTLNRSSISRGMRRMFPFHISSFLLIRLFLLKWRTCLDFYHSSSQKKVNDLFIKKRLYFSTKLSHLLSWLCRSKFLQFLSLLKHTALLIGFFQNLS